MSDQSEKIESIMHEARSFAPARQFSKDAHIKTEKAYEREYKRSIDSGDKFWAGAARKLDWFKKWDKELEWNPPVARWFTGGEINACHNCVDRHLATRGDHEAIIWEGEPGETKRITFKELHKEVCKFANVLKDNGVATGDRVALYMPMIPELAIAMLACARIGATHSIIFGGFSAQAIADRCHDAGVSAIVTADGGYRRGKPVPLKDTVDEAIAGNADIKKVFVVQRCRNDVKWTDGRDIWWHEAMAEASEDCPAERLDANHPLFILYTSGTTGKPKGIYHGTGGYLTYAYTTTKFIFDLKPDDIFWCTADIGWITGHSYVVYGALANGVTTVMYEGA
ncbi:MAG: AMP-binding protein, partial [Chrysiogenetes bacterium]|nr:AMP-binding protein [Chrysiogenetes bacterium]